MVFVVEFETVFPVEPPATIFVVSTLFVAILFATVSFAAILPEVKFISMSVANTTLVQNKSVIIKTIIFFKFNIINSS